MTRSGLLPCEVTQTLRDDDRVTLDEGDRGRADEVLLDALDSGLAGGDRGQRVLRHGVGGVVTE